MLTRRKSFIENKDEEEIEMPQEAPVMSRKRSKLSSILPQVDDDELFNMNPPDLENNASTFFNVTPVAALNKTSKESQMQAQAPMSG